MSPSEGPAALQPVCTVHRTRVTTNLGLWERNAIYGRNANVWRLGRCVCRRSTISVDQPFPDTRPVIRFIHLPTRILKGNKSNALVNAERAPFARQRLVCSCT